MSAAPSLSAPAALRNPRESNASGAHVMLASDLDDALHATLYDLLVDEGYDVCVPRDPAEGLGMLRAGDCGAIVILPLPPTSAADRRGWLAALAAAQSKEPLIGRRLRARCALIGLAFGPAGHENTFVAVSPLWDTLLTRWRATLAAPFDLEALMSALHAASQRLHSVA
jgi:hypothetical protein